MIELRRVRCTKCGAEFNDDYDPTASVLRCKRLGCGATFVVHQAQDLAAKHPDREIDILNLRKLLDEAVNANDTELMIQRAQEIRSYVPDDAFASYIESLGQKMRKQYKLYQQFLAAAGDMTSEDAQRILTIALNREHFSDHDREAVIMFIDNHLDNEHKALWRMRLDNAVKRLFEDQERYSVIPRDVFICHSSADTIALEIYRALTDDGVKCWISEENLPPKTEYYWPKIEEAIRNCKIILVVCSQSAMLRDDPMKEMLYAESQNLKKLEFKVDDKPHTTFFRHYFNGIQWIKLDENNKEASFSMLKDRVYLLLNDTKQQTLVIQKDIQKENLHNAEFDIQRELEEVKRQEA
ncbi:MAG: TIR domain-containing protein, partial [Clostridiales bacterium]|nr:TIR domain-containing protein [Clostridiales bacterium]